MSAMFLVTVIISIGILLNFKTDIPNKTLYIRGFSLGTLAGVCYVYINGIVLGMHYGIAHHLFHTLFFSLISMAGFILAERAQLSDFWSNKNKHSKLKQILIGVSLGVIFGLLLILIVRYANAVVGESSANWSELITSFKTNGNVVLNVIVASIQAAISEEVLFRLFAISGIVYLLRGYQLKKRKMAILIAVIVSALLFAFNPMQHFALGLILSSIIGYVYVEYGLVTVLALHFVGDIINLTYHVMSL